jgi:excisionase family DNA binding protein
MTMPKEWYTLDEAAEYLGVSKRTVYKWSKEGRLRTYILGQERTRRFRKEDLDSVPRLLENDEQEMSKGASASKESRKGQRGQP